MTKSEAGDEEGQGADQVLDPTADEEHHPSLRAVAVPILRPDGTVFAAPSTAAPALRRGMDDLVALVPLLRPAADELGARLPAR